MLPIYFAPLQGFTECAYRQAHFLFASEELKQNAGSPIAAYYSPFLRVEKGEARAKDLRDLQQDLDFAQSHSTYKIIPQIICKDTGEFNILVDAIVKLNDLSSGSRKFDEIDINMGCPFPMQAKSGRGSGLLPRIDAAREILAEVARKNAEQELRFSVKMRLGNTSPEESLALLPLLNETPLTHVTMHPRLGIQQYKGALDFVAFDSFYKDCVHPLIFNGEILGKSQAEQIQGMYPKLKGVMLGRGLLANPTLGKSLDTETVLKIHGYILDSYRHRLQGGAQILDKIRPFWTYLDSLPKRNLKRIEKTRNLENYTQAVTEILQ